MYISNVSGANRLLHIAPKNVPKKAVDKGEAHILCTLWLTNITLLNINWSVWCENFQLDKSRRSDGRNAPELFQYACIFRHIYNETKQNTEISSTTNFISLSLFR